MKEIEVSGSSDAKRSYGAVMFFKPKIAGKHLGAALATESLSQFDPRSNFSGEPQETYGSKDRDGRAVTATWGLTARPDALGSHHAGRPALSIIWAGQESSVAVLSWSGC